VLHNPRRRERQLVECDFVPQVDGTLRRPNDLPADASKGDACRELTTGRRSNGAIPVIGTVNVRTEAQSVAIVVEVDVTDR
jgi:hypothetical protein